METTWVSANIGQDKYRTSIESDNQRWIADEPIAKGGNGEGPSPFQHLLAALGACTCITLRMYANRKQWLLEHVHVDLSMISEEGKTNINRNIQLTGALAEDQRSRLLQIANKCPVHKLLTGSIEIDTKLLSS